MKILVLGADGTGGYFGRVCIKVAQMWLFLCVRSVPSRSKKTDCKLKAHRAMLSFM